MSKNLFGANEEYRGKNKKMRLQERKSRIEEEEENEWFAQEKQDNAMGFLILCGFLVIAVNNLMKYGQL